MSNLATITNNILADSGIDDINVVVTTGSYADPAWITSLSWTKITGAPSGIVTGIGNTNYLSKFTSNGSTIGNSAFFDGGGFGGFNSTGIGSRTFVINAASGRPLALEVVEFANVHSISIRPNNSGFNAISSNYISGGTFLPLSISGRENNADLVLQTNGNVGIGTSSPATQLNVGHENHGIGFAYLGASSFPPIAGIFTSDGTAGGQTGYGSLLIKARTDYAPFYSINFFTASSANLSVERMRITAGGNIELKIPASTTQGILFKDSGGTSRGKVYYGDASGEMYFGTMTGYSTVFVTNDIPRMSIFSDGNVSISNSPSNAGFKLDVNGTGRFSGQLTASNNITAAGIIYGRTTNNFPSSGLGYYAIRTNNFDGERGGITLQVSSSTNTLTDALTINYLGVATFSSSVTSNTNGFVAINGYGLTSYPSSSATGANIIFSSSIFGGVDGIYQSSGNTSDFAIWTNGGTSTQAKLYIKNNGNVLIGTNNDAGFKLDVNGTGRFSGNLFLSGTIANSGDAATLTIKQASTTFTNGIYLERAGERNGYYMYIGGALDALTFRRNYFGTQSDVMSLNRDGNVGIGNGGNASYRLLVSGNNASVDSNGQNTIFLSASPTANFLATSWIGGGSAVPLIIENNAIRAITISTSAAVTINQLSGSGNRIVVANSGGTLISAVIGSGLAFDGTTLTATGGSSGSISGSGTSGTVALFTGTSSIGNSVISQTSGSIGIGTATPNRKLEVITGSLTTNGIRLTYAQGVTGEGMDITYLNTGNTTTSFDSIYNSDSAVMQFRMKTAATPVTALSILGSGAATFSSSVTSTHNTNGQIAIVPTTNTNAASFLAQNAGGSAYFGKNNSSGGAFTGAAYATVVYSGGNVPMGFYTNDAERFRITSDGTIGFNGNSGVGDAGIGKMSMGFADGAYGWIQTWSGRPLLLNPSGNPVIIGSTSNNGTRFQVTGGGSFTSSVTASSFFESSDATIKTLVQDNYQAKGIENVVAKLYIKNGKQELGYFAQDLESILPSAVNKGSDGLLNLSYREVHTAKIAALEKEIAELKKQLKNN
jgi:hypothetical protein